MKTLATILLSVLLLLVLGGVGGYFYMQRKFAPPANQLRVAGLPASGRFAWQADSSARPAVAHAHQLVPVRVPGCARTCYLQFDTGAPYTVFYAHPLAALRAQYPAAGPALVPQADTVHDVQFSLGGAELRVRRAPVLNYGAHALPADTAAPFVIGTLGADVLEGRVLVIDYPRQRFSLYAATPDSLARRADFVPLELKGRRVMLSAELPGQSGPLMFDSGSSAFALLTSQSRWQELIRPAAPVRTKAVNSWGKMLTTYTAPTAAALRLGATELPLGTVSYMTGMTLMQEMLTRVSGLAGMLGNEPFAGRTIILDAPGGRFGVVR
ncbi:hypothetical protein [Hymenobacter jeollabukensis]|uniref:Uncharacterized protein n=1 Tax=Hymenobacter jeollabukensis TaxID=2025313 RepID=A0A5R8WWN6_9BACT|nr:hypothetical protein [Hymenobacter jeollabukensis]TLM96565.1 hypothetical protein FDY95_00800 [Hymenobacter jeollabukensis]